MVFFEWKNVPSVFACPIIIAFNRRKPKGQQCYYCVGVKVSECGRQTCARVLKNNKISNFVSDRVVDDIISINSIRAGESRTYILFCHDNRTRHSNRSEDSRNRFMDRTKIVLFDPIASRVFFFYASVFLHLYIVRSVRRGAYGVCCTFVWDHVSNLFM